MSLDEYREKRKKEYLQELKELVIEYYNRFNKTPDDKVLREFFPVYLNRNEIKKQIVGIFQTKKYIIIL